MFVTAKTQLYLKQNIQFEPLFNHWYVWFHLIPPATAALNLSQRYLNVMTSYVNSPFLHVAAVKDPDMRGGPFIDLGGKRIDEVRALIRETRERHAPLLEFAEAVNSLHRLLGDKARGMPLHPLYAEVPAPLRGYVELVYDLTNQPSFRLLEALLYQSPYYSLEAQSIELSQVEEDHGRPFILSTPRLPQEHVLHLPIPFARSGLDALFKMKKLPGTFELAVEQLGVPTEGESLFRTFFTETPPPDYEPYQDDSFRIRYFGHACILLESAAVSILLDPILSYSYQAGISRYTYLDLPDSIDYVLITHAHQDHILLETMLQLRHKTQCFVVPRNADGLLQDPSLQLALENLGFANVIEMRDLQEISIPGGAITALPFLGEHHDLSIQSKACFLIRLEGKSILVLADSCNIDPYLYDHLHDLYGDMDTLFLGMECDGAPLSWAYGPLFPEPPERGIDKARRARGCNFEEALALVERFHFKEVYVYAMGQEPWLHHILDNNLGEDSNPIIQSKKLIEVCRSRGIGAEFLFGEKEILAGGR